MVASGHGVRIATSNSPGVDRFGFS